MSVTNRVDIIIPAYDVEKYIEETLQSIFSQQYQDIEIIVVNDGSRDNTQQILTAFQDRITLINQNQSGPSYARNIGIKAGNGEFIALMDSDDLWEPDFLNRTVNFLTMHTHLGFVFVENDVFTDEGVITPHWIKDDGRVARIPILKKEKDETLFSRRIWSDLAIGSFIPTSGILIRRSALEKVGLFDENLTNAEDRDFFIRLAHEFDAGYIETCLSRKRERPDGLCQNIEKVVLGSDIVSNRFLENYEIELPLRKTIKKHLSNQWFALGRNYLEQNKGRLASTAFMRSFRYHPEVRSLSFWILSVTGMYRSIRSVKRQIYGN